MVLKRENIYYYYCGQCASFHLASFPALQLWQWGCNPPGGGGLGNGGTPSPKKRGENINVKEEKPRTF